MKRVYQSRIEKNHGTCMQAVVASLFEMFIDDVPNFVELGDEWFWIMSKFYKDRGYRLSCFNPRTCIKLTKQILKVDEGINGYWYATVPSINLGPGVTHAVVIDKNMKVVHDPNPNNYGHVYSPKDIISIDTCSDKWYLDVNKKLVIKEDDK